MYNWCQNTQKTSSTSLVLPLICAVLVTQEQMPNVTHNAMINVVMPFNASKCQWHLTITMPVIGTIIVMCQHMHKTTDPLQLNRLQQATISWYWQWLPAQLCPQMHQMQHGRPLLRMLSCFEGNMPCSCRHCVHRILYLTRSQIRCNWLPVQLLHIHHPTATEAEWLDWRLKYLRLEVGGLYFCKKPLLE